ncbi:TlpA family protein disulfide reductase [Nocardioides nanhaiensis]|uniref:Thioredoxin domain-containing protein n=1 Tax=Nocardioides nanhaiensis TaxID=1476871 RepID=A0ABP8WA11_9ACTN
MRTPARRYVRHLTALAAATALLALGACASGDPDSTDSTRAAGQEAAPTATPTDVEPSAPAGSTTPPADDPGAAAPSAPAVPEVLDFEAVGVDGSPFSGAEVAGRPVVVWFWAPWCAVCRSQVPEVEALVEEHGDDVAFLGVGSLDGEEAIAGFAEEVPGVRHLSDPDGELYQRFGIAEQSSFVVLDAEGGEVLRTGYGDDDELAGVVDELAS